MADWQKGYQYNVAPLVVRNMVILGPGDQRSGRQLLGRGVRRQNRKRTLALLHGPHLGRCSPRPKPGRAIPGSTAAARSGTAAAYDPETNLTFWGTGNPNPGWNGDPRTPGDNLYSDSVIALDADTGKLKWYYQFTPGDEYDWDSTQVPVLVDMEWKGQPRKVMLWANRNGFFYVLDRTTGEFLLGKNFVKQNWNLGFDKNGRPDQGPRASGRSRWAASLSSRATRVAPTGIRRPTARGPDSFTFQPGRIPAAHPAKGDPGKWVEGQRYTGNRNAAGRGAVGRPGGAPRRGSRQLQNGRGRIRRDPGDRSEDRRQRSGNSRWSTIPRTAFFPLPAIWCSAAAWKETSSPSTRRTGELLWHANLGGPNASGPISYAVNGKQYIVGTGEGTMYVFALPDENEPPALWQQRS